MSFLSIIFIVSALILPASLFATPLDGVTWDYNVDSWLYRGTPIGYDEEPEYDDPEYYELENVS